MNRGKIISGILALLIYFGIIFLFFYFYNIHQTKAKNYVDKNSNRVTVTLVNIGNKAFNKSLKKSNRVKPTPPIITPPIHHIKRPNKRVVSKKHIIKKHIPKKVLPKKVVPKKHIIKKHIPKKVVPKKVVPKKYTPKKVVPKKVVPKKHTPKKVVPKKVVPKKHTPKKVVPKKVVPKKTAKDLFSSIKTDNVKNRPVKREPRDIKHIVAPKFPTRVNHSSSVSDRIKNRHQIGRVSNANRDRGIKNAYIAKIKRHMNNWNANSAYKGKRVSLSLTIYNSGRFSYKIISGGDRDMKRSLSQFLDRLNRMGQLGKHSKSSPYLIRVDFIVR